MDLKPSGQTALVTGGAGGIGGAIVEALAEEGCNVAFCSRSEESVARRRESLLKYPVTVIGRALNVLDGNAIDNWLAELGSVDIFIPTVSAISADIEETLSTDIETTILWTEKIIPYLRQSSHGAITYIGSLGTQFAMPTNKAYGLAKAGMVHYMKSLSRELASQGTRVNLVSPGYIEIEGGTWSNWRKSHSEIYQAAVKNNPFGRLGTGEEIGKVVAFISSPVASFVSGADWFVDGATSLNCLA
ncbi:NAD(P)-dependent dehydrogenase (short-subunit alcohol dehydrogenase family) [Novosphingobium fluoreni]|uniref:NAD(P)-dependent dehydrogenase (Short-subunit alcohol dehydrogenase family) n=1 Tax=Novosphingobium fluoreni TaxID=1391222 RepID=A0A7W6C8E7_9SPHN|nr:SDR family oxidoreductase [Novosphingobium fluoreni]MBB3941486.1 NAD(P)-dependent dehydrogenase (short-subunit alcohol dehydrogenase family) [Novosphingobium fluoreni]